MVLKVFVKMSKGLVVMEFCKPRFWMGLSSVCADIEENF